MANKKQTIYICDKCGNEFPTWSGKCSMCGEWNSLQELRLDRGTNIDRRRDFKVETININDINTESSPRTKTSISELDRVLGGGIVAGSIILLGGEPGIGKSTLILQLADKLKKVFYLSAEESVEQIKMRAKRLSVKNDQIVLSSDWDIESVLSEVKKVKPDLFIVDSIQTITKSSVDGTAGSIMQVRECGILLQQFAKSTRIPVVLIGHVTKEGNIAGPRILEHLVDVVLYLEGDHFNDARLLRGVKNRFGATNEVGVFAMNEKGMEEIKNPSQVFLGERVNNPGSVITVTLEGTRPILVEIQALVIPTSFGFPKRTSSGFDLNRLNLLAAVITKKTPVNLSNYDIYLNVIGGVKLAEPAVDLAVCAAMISSYKNKKYDDDACFYGEIGLSGEIRKVMRQDDRKKEAMNLGYSPDMSIKYISELTAKLK